VNDFDNVDVDAQKDVKQANIHQMSDFDENYSEDEDIEIIDDVDGTSISDNYP
jgi:hypothetical protein